MPGAKSFWRSKNGTDPLYHRAKFGGGSGFARCLEVKKSWVFVFVSLYSTSRFWKTKIVNATLPQRDRMLKRDQNMINNVQQSIQTRRIEILELWELY